MAPQNWLRWAGGIFVAVNLCGCATAPSWDDLTSREFAVKSLWTTPAPPLEVIAKSSDGYARAKAFNMLDETSNREENDKRLQALQAGAVADRDPLCRLAALRTLGRYKSEPRAANILTEVYLGNPGMSAENNAFIRQQALTSLQTNSPADAKQLFLQAARQPNGSLTGAAQRDRTEILDERLTAIRALAKYPQPDSLETLVRLIETEKDTAIRKCAHESLVTATKKDIPLDKDGKAWREFVNTGRQPAPQNNGLLAGLKKFEPLPSTPSNTPGVLDKISAWARPEKQPDPIPQSQAPGTLPATLPATPLSNQRNLLRRDVAPVTTPGIVPAGATRNAQGELLVPVTP